ncbi:MAG: type 2 isopentenyl-diphosphate Delta-isomerase [Firmicutes bacterium]|jgi:isopentenyl-diphosphate delta-isomerase|nr:type 2 isopentenyl-diphosphate Delta-isomerase [Bacillota bacterium]
MNQEHPKNNSIIIRQQRKDQHLRLGLSLPDGPGCSCFQDVLLVPEALPELSITDIDISTKFCGLNLKAPLIINALTGGTRWAAAINARLAEVAKRTGLALAVGSQRIALANPEVVYSFTIVRRINPDGIVLANLGANSSVDDAYKAVDMLAADGLQLHLNAAQELAMAEGDRSFFWSEPIGAVAQEMSVPVIAKEVGCGLSGQTARRLLELGVSAIDIGGLGGTNFIAIENCRQGKCSSPLNSWGLPTVWSLLDIMAVNPQAEICATGGLRNGLDMAKALAMGAKACGMAKPILAAVTLGGIQAGVNFVEQCLRELKTVMLLVGAKDLAALRHKTVLFGGKTWNYLQQRGWTSSQIKE